MPKKNKIETFVTESVAVADLKPHPKNYKSHPDAQLDHIVHSIKTNGFYRNIVIAKDNVILTGHGVVLASKKMGIESVPVVRVNIDSDSPKALKILTSDNEISNLAQVDDRALSEMLKTILDTSDDKLLGTGFDESQLSALVMATRPESEIGDKHSASDWVGMPDYDEGKTYFKVIFNFDDVKERDAFVKKFELTVFGRKEGNTWSVKWPQDKKRDIKSVEFE